MQKTILVTGGNRGIGLEICRQLAELGHIVIVGVRSIEQGREAVQGFTGEIIVQSLEVTQRGSIGEVAKFIADTYGKLDVLINNAGIGVGNTGAVNADMNEVKQIIETNFYGAWYMAQEMIPLLHKSQEGRIINMSSEMGALDNLAGGYAGYRLSKVSLNGLTILLANELKDEGIKVNAVSPGWVRTDMGGENAHRSVSQGADTAVWLATAPNISTGKFFKDRKEIDW